MKRRPTGRLSDLPRERELLRARGLALLVAALLLGLGLLLCFQILAGRLVDDLHGEAHLAALVKAEKLHLDLVAFLDDVRDLLHPARRELADVHEPVLGAEEVHEGAEVHHLDHGALVDVTDLGLGRDRLDPVDRRLHRVAVGGRHLHRAVVANVDLGTGLLHDLADHLAARADHLANLVDRDVEHLDARGVLAELVAVLGQRRRHLAQDVHAPVLRLAERDAHDLLGDAGDLDVHLQRGHAPLGARHLEVHIAEMVLVAEDVGQHGIALVLKNEAHGDAGGRALERHARVHQRQRRAAHGGHGGEAVRLRDLRHHAQRVGKFVVRRQDRMDGAPGELAVTDLAAARPAHSSGLADREWREVVMQEERLLVGPLQRVDPLLILAGAQRCYHQRLGLAAGEQGRAVHARQHADLGDNGTHRLHVAAIDATTAIEDVPAHDLGFDLLEDARDLLRRIGRVLRAFRAEMRHHLGLGGVDRGAAVSDTCSSRGSFAAFSASLMMASITGWKWRWPNITAPSITSSLSSFASDSTINTASCVPATTRSSWLSVISSSSGLSTYSLLTKPTRAAPIGPMKGAPESVNAAEAAIIARTSGSFSRSCDSVVTITWVSLRQPSANSGRTGRSINRETSVSFSVGRPSRLK